MGQSCASVLSGVIHLQRHRILIVEDDDNIRSVVAYCLRRSGYTVLLARDGRDALARLREQDISLILLDLALPRLDGFGLLAQLQDEGNLSKVSVIVLTAFEDEANQQRSFELGVKRFIAKPFSPRELVAAVNGVLDSAAAAAGQASSVAQPTGSSKLNTDIVQSCHT